MHFLAILSFFYILHTSNVFIIYLLAWASQPGFMYTPFSPFTISHCVWITLEVAYSPTFITTFFLGFQASSYLHLDFSTNILLYLSASSRIPVTFHPDSQASFLNHKSDSVSSHLSQPSCLCSCPILFSTPVSFFTVCVITEPPREL